MYTKVFRAMYEGTLADNWQALVTFQQLLILANDDGVVDMTIAAIHRITSIPVEILEAGIKVLEAPDHGSRTPDMEGKRISRLDEHRDWGWFLVNFAKYRQMVTREEKKEADRARIQAKREVEKSNVYNDVADCRNMSQHVAACSSTSQDVADVAHIDLDLDLDLERAEALKPEDKSSVVASKPATPTCQQSEIVSLYHELLPSLTRVRDWTPERQAYLRKRWSEKTERQSLEWWRTFFGYVAASDFLMGRVSSRDGRAFECDLEWLVRPKNFVKVIEGKYENRGVAA